MLAFFPQTGDGMSNFAIAGVQMHIRNDDNSEAIERHVRSTVFAFPWVQMVVVGEAAPVGFRQDLAVELPGPAEDRYRDLARELGIWLIPGSFMERAGETYHNTAIVIAPDGEVVARYRKLFPFYPYESFTTPGEEVCVFDVPGVGRFGLAICYDKWFPEVQRQMCWQGAEVIIQVTATGTIDRDVETAISRANAAVNQCYFVDVNGAKGPFGNGRSVVYAPEGELVHEAGEAEEVFPVMLDLERVRRTRQLGIHGLAQAMKSFRDSKVVFPAYQAGREVPAAMAELGALRMPLQRDMAMGRMQASEVIDFDAGRPNGTDG
jgi:predicted amidohydrolase